MEQAQIFEIIDALLQLPKFNGNTSKSLTQLDQNIKKALSIFPSDDDLHNQLKHVTGVTQKFTKIALKCLKILAASHSDESLASLFSVQQQEKIKLLIQVILSLGVVPGLLKGINTLQKNKTFQIGLLNLEEYSLIKSYRLMVETIRCLFDVVKVPSLRSIITYYLGDLMAAMLQVAHAGPLKKPVKTNFAENSAITSQSDFVMTEETYQELLKDKIEFKEMYQKLVSDMYKPLVIKELLFLMSPHKSTINGEFLHSPAWFKKVITNQLTEYLLSPGGVSLVMRALCQSGSDEIDWLKVEALTKLITTVQGNMTDEEFYSRIGPQVVSLLNMTGPYCLPVAKNCIKRIYEENAQIADKYIFEQMFEAFIMCSKPLIENFSGVLVNEDSLSRCIDQLSKCFGLGSKESSVPIAVLVKIIKILYKLYMKVGKSAYEFKTNIQDLIIEFLYSEKDHEKLKSIYDALLFDKSHENMLEMNKDLEFQFGPSGGVQVSKRLEDLNFCKPSLQSAEIQLEVEMAGDDMLDLLSSNRLGLAKILLSDFFVVLLSFLSDFYDSKSELIKKANLSLMTVDDLIVFLLEASQKKIITIKLLAVLAENTLVAETIQEKPEIVFGFVKTLLELKAKNLAQGQNAFETTLVDEDGTEDEEDVAVAMVIVDLMTLNLKSTSDRWNTLKSLVDSLELIALNCKDSAVKHYSELLLHRLRTHGAVSGGKKPKIWMQDLSSNMSCKLHSTASKKTDHTAASKLQNKKLIVELDNEVVEKSQVDVIFEDIRSADVATRGHAIIELGKFLRKKDKTALARAEYAFSALLCNLRHNDTYIYLSAINALEALGSIWKADKVLEILCEEYTVHKKDSTEMQTKIGEVLMRITRGLGEMVPKYRALLINTFLFGTKSSDEFLRASSLSNLGELLRILGRGVGPIIQEVLFCVKAIVETDKSLLARRAAIMVIEFLLKGLSGDAFMVLEFVIRDLYRALLQLYKTDKDDIVRLHAELALLEINRLVKCPTLEPKKLEKHIGILSLSK